MLAGGTDEEFSAFAAADGGQLVGFAFLLTGNRHDAEDLAQQALVRTAARWPTARESPARYSRTVLLNLVKDRWRVRQRHAETLAADLTDLSPVADAAETMVDRQLDTRARETALPAGRRLLPQAVGSDEVQDALLTPDGQHIIASVTYNGLSDVTANTVIGGIVQLSAQGQPLQILLAQRAIPSRLDYEATSCQLASVDPTGEHLLVSCAPAIFGRLDRARFTGLPVAGSVGIAAAAW